MTHPTKFHPGSAEARAADKPHGGGVVAPRLKNSPTICPVMGRFGHCWSAPDKNVVRECLWCSEKKAAE